MEGNVSRIILPDFLEAMHLLTVKYNGYSKDIVILDTIKHPFSIGLGVINTETIDSSFLDCWKLALEWSCFKVSGHFIFISIFIFHAQQSKELQLFNSSFHFILIFAIYKRFHW